jgi:pSer/pThr/pTyr-binding forkhead associated (FHA) protein
MPTLTVVSERTPVQAYNVDAASLTIGRGDDMDIVIDNPSVSRKQAQIRREPDGHFVVEDLGSANGTFLNGRRITGPAPLTQGDEISFGKYSVYFDRVLRQPLATAAPPAKSDRRPTETFQMDVKDVEHLQKTVALKRRAHLKWEAAGKLDTFYLERLERNAVLVGRSRLCDLRVPAGPRHHLLIVRNRTGYEVRNLCTWFRMRVNGTAAAQAMLKGGDVIELRGLRVTFFDEIG